MGNLLAALEMQMSVVLPVIIIGLSLISMLPRGGRAPSRMSKVVPLVLAWGSMFSLMGFGQIAVHDFLFGCFATVAVLGGILMITSRNSAYSALWFAMVTLSVCGLFLLRSAPFLSAATVIVYAGAIIVTFLFVLMLAQQEGTAYYDAQSSHPILATIFGMLLFGTVILGITSWDRNPISAPVVASNETGAKAETHRFITSEGTKAANAWSRHPAGEVGSMHALGRSVFGDYLFAVELAGTLLLVACVGAVAMAPRRPQGTL